ncbi:hypothetical protein OIU76_029180 [Salix suchowensis]|nr:hypothetical protein OIU76_029180 [Salix suchowensis]
MTLPNSWGIVATGFFDKSEVAKAFSCMKAALCLYSENKGWKPNQRVINGILSWLGDEGSAEDAEAFVSSLNTVIPMNREMYHAVLKANIRAGFGLISPNRVLTDKDQGARKPGSLDFGDTCSWGGGGNFSAGQGSGNLGIDISLCNGAAGERKVVDGGEIGGGISWTNFSAAMAIPVVCLGHCCSSYSDGVGGGTTPDLGTGGVNGLVVEMMVLEKDWVLTMVAELGTAVVEMAASVIEVVQVLMQGSVPVMVLEVVALVAELGTAVVEMAASVIEVVQVLMQGSVPVMVLEVVALVAELVLHLVMAMVAMKGVGDEPAIVGGSGSSSVGGGEPSNGTGGGSGSKENNIPALGPFSTGSILHTSELPKQWCLWRNCCIL